MDSPDVPDRAVLLAVGLMVVLAPVLILSVTLGFLILTGDLVLGGLTPIEFIELYLLELAVLAVFAYALYRVMLALVVHKLPSSLDALNEASENGTAEERRQGEVRDGYE